MLQEEMGLQGKSMHQLTEKSALLTLVACLNMTNGRFDLVASSFSAPMMIPLSIKTAGGHIQSSENTLIKGD